MLGSAIRAGLDSSDEDHSIIAPGRRELDLLDEVAVKQFFSGHRFDAVIHCAGQLGGIQSHAAEQISYLVENSRVNLNVIENAINSRVPTLVNFGTAAWYGGGGEEAQTEETIARGLGAPDNEAYSLAKYLGLKLCQYANKTGLGYATIIPCNLYGPADNFSAAGHIIPAAINKTRSALLNRDDSIEIWGDGSAQREFMFVGDLAELTLWCLDNIEGLPDYFNAGPGETHSILQVYETIADIMGYEGGYSFDLSRPVGSKVRRMSSALIHKHGWQASTTLREGLIETIKYFQEHQDG